jgi:hypothetical protein
MDAARAFMKQEPFYSNGVYKDINFRRWRFGRVMDRFKQRIAGDRTDAKIVSAINDRQRPWHAQTRQLSRRWGHVREGCSIQPDRPIAGGLPPR